MNKQQTFNYGQWTVQLTLDDTYFDTRENELYVRIYCVGTWYSVNGSLWDTWECARYDTPEFLSEKLKDKINKRARTMMYNYRKNI